MGYPGAAWEWAMTAAMLKAVSGELPRGYTVRFDDPAWQTHPLRTSLRIIKSLVRKSAAPLRETVVPYDEGRSRIVANLATAIGLRVLSTRSNARMRLVIATAFSTGESDKLSISSRIASSFRVL